ncbi:hypothetical protein EIP91_004409 [Steccherinum ochraceum]|uniref:Alpha/beta hydrolase fold-3 domain-containing protein n=1 Tax=Steccherinum ochraceum TaxID=92696 RepID=A0A4R0RZY8_9APHY|nr:hypothetical protein EIP91_004409 [Steccherinum ochraceum]
MADTPIAHYEVLESEFAKEYGNSPPFTFCWDDIPTKRKQLVEVFLPLMREQLKGELPEPSTYISQDHFVPVASGTANIRIRMITPTAGGPFPVFYFIHGGGFISGSAEFMEAPMTIAAVELGIVVALGEYRLAPENPHPTQVNDCVEGVKWVVNNADTLEADLSKGFVVGGESAGGSLAATTVHILCDDPSFPENLLTGQILQIPCTVDPRAVPEEFKAEYQSMHMAKNYNPAGMTRELLADMYAKHLRNTPSDPTASPLLFPSHASLPPTIIQVAGLDYLRDDGILYNKLLRRDGVQSKLIIYPGVPHGFRGVYPHLKVSKQYDEDLRKALRSFMPGARR